jgi:hypothetical protein
VAAAFIEECDRLIGRDHLLKRSILLVKVCSLHVIQTIMPWHQKYSNSFTLFFLT